MSISQFIFGWILTGIASVVALRLRYKKKTALGFYFLAVLLAPLTLLSFILDSIEPAWNAFVKFMSIKL